MLHCWSDVNNLGRAVGKISSKTTRELSSNVEAAPPEMTFTIRPYAEIDHAAVRELFIRVNRELAPPAMSRAFESYVTLSLREEIDRIADYYTGKHGAFFVSHDVERLAGMFGLEGVGTLSAELRRMYEDAPYRKRGLARAMLEHAERICRDADTPVLTLSTSELQEAALALYRKSGYRLVREERPLALTNKSLGGDIRRYYFEKELATRCCAQRSRNRIRRTRGTLASSVPTSTLATASSSDSERRNPAVKRPDGSAAPQRARAQGQRQRTPLDKESGAAHGRCANARRHSPRGA